MKPGDSTPASIRLDRDGSFVVDWRDGHQSVLSPETLRRGCPCAVCREERVLGRAGTSAPASGATSVPPAGAASAPASGANSIRASGTSSAPVSGVSSVPGSGVAPVPPLYRIERWERVGRYGVSIVWGDGHSTGIYSWPILRDLCQCFACRAAREDL